MRDTLNGVVNDGNAWEVERYMYQKPRLIHEVNAFFFSTG